jgi:cytochrome c biogenesis protein CcmG/thiol:disulfide interchange protein DsbE
MAVLLALTACTHTTNARPSPEPTPIVGTDPCPADLPAAPPAGGQRLPDVTLACIGSGSGVSMRALGGTPTVVNLWASWCFPCRTEMPEYQKVHRALGAKVRFLGVDTKDAQNDARSAIQRAAITYPSVFDPDERVRRALNARSLPTTVLVGADGLIKNVHVGEQTAAELQAAITKYLGVT